MAKVYRKEQAPRFVPVILELETQDEVDALHALLNYDYLNQALKRALGGNPLVNLWSKTKDYASRDYDIYFNALGATVRRPIS